MSHVKEDGEREQLTSCKQQGKQHEEHRRGLCSVITSWPRLSIIRRVKGRDGPQQFLVQQSVSSAAKYTLCPTVFLISYLFCASKPVKTEKIGTELLNFCSASGQKSANSKATLREGRPRSQSCQRQLLAKGSGGEGPSSRAAWRRSSERRSHHEDGNAERAWRCPSVPSHQTRTPTARASTTVINNTAWKIPREELKGWELKKLVNLGVKQEKGSRGHKYIQNEKATKKASQSRFTAAQMENNKSQDRHFD